MPKSEGSLRCHCGNFRVTVRECDLSLANLWEPFLQYSHIRNRVAQQNASRCLNWCVRHSRHYFFPPFRPTNCWKLQVQTCSSSCTSPEGMLQGILGNMARPRKSGQRRRGWTLPRMFSLEPLERCLHGGHCWTTTFFFLRLYQEVMPNSLKCGLKAVPRAMF